MQLTLTDGRVVERVCVKFVKNLADLDVAMAEIRGELSSQKGNLMIELWRDVEQLRDNGHLNHPKSATRERG